MDYISRLGPAEYAFYLRMEADSSLWNVVLNKNKTMDIVQKVSNSTFNQRFFA
jgi:hypothetical protein